MGNPLKVTFEPRTIEHLGVRMYSTLPPALAELISNSYDADAEKVSISLKQNGSTPISITINDDGCGMSLTELNTKFLVIGRNRRMEDSDAVSPRFKRKATGKKGLGKLALFGLSQTIEVTTVKKNKKNQIKLIWDSLISSKGEYKPDWTIQDTDTKEADGTTIKLFDLKRKSKFDIQELSKSLARIFFFNDNFNLEISDSERNVISVTNIKKYEDIIKEFSWQDTSWNPEGSDYPDLKGEIISTKKPISPKSGLRGITIYSRGKLVNSPEFFSESTSSHFYQYVTGYIIADFIDEVDQDVISTNRQSIDWENEEMSKFRTFLEGVVSRINTLWRNKRKEKKDKEIKDATGGIDKEVWMSKLPKDIRSSANAIIETLAGDEAISKITPVIKELHKIVPEYPLLHWRHLHEKLKNRIYTYYENEQFGEAARQGCLIYLDFLREFTGRTSDGLDLVNPIFKYDKSSNPPKLPEVQITSLSNESEKNIQEGHAHFSRGLVTGFRNPIQHTPMFKAVPGIFSELDCLNILSLISYLLSHLDGATKNTEDGEAKP